MSVFNNGTSITETVTYVTELAVSNVTIANPLVVSSGGTGRATLTANNVVLGNGTTAVNFVGPGASGNVLTSNGTTWVSQAPAASGITTGKAIAMALIFGF
jgi:hypothetical protein